MNVDGSTTAPSGLDPDDPARVRLIDQRELPFELRRWSTSSTDQMVTAIADMGVRGAGLIGVAAGYGMDLAAVEGAGLHRCRPRPCRPADRPWSTWPGRSTACRRPLRASPWPPGGDGRAEVEAIVAEDVAACQAIGRHGLPLIEEIHEHTGRPVNVLTHCNAGWLAFVDHGSATAPIYAAHDAGIPVHVWVDETRPRNQGARLTAWELGRARACPTPSSSTTPAAT